MKQQTLAMASDKNFGQFLRPTRRDMFLKTRDKIVPWQDLCSVVEMHYPKGEGGRLPIGLERMMRMLFVQHWFNLADQACEEALYDGASLRSFVGIDLGRELVPDCTTLLRLRRLLEQHQLGQALFAKVGELLQGRGMEVGTGTIVDATIISAPSSTKNKDKDKKRDPEMQSVGKGKNYFFGKLHIGVDSSWGLVHSAVVTAANVHDKHPLPDLLHGEEFKVYGNSTYAGQQELIETRAPLAPDCTNQRVRNTKGVRVEKRRRNNREKSKVCFRVEHVFAIIKRQCGLSKVRYRGLHKKNATRAFTALALANIYMSRGLLLAQVRP